MRTARTWGVGLVVLAMLTCPTAVDADHDDSDDDDDNDKNFKKLSSIKLLTLVRNGTVRKHHKDKHAKKETSHGSSMVLSKDSCTDYAEDLDCGLKNVKNDMYCTMNKCRALVTNMKGRSCDQYCQGLGRQCVGAWEEASNSCMPEETWTCNQTTKMFGETTSDLICECTSASGSSTDMCAQPLKAPECTATGAGRCTGMKTHANCPTDCKKDEAGCLAYACKEFADDLREDMEDEDEDEEIWEWAGNAALAAVGGVVTGAILAYVLARSRKLHEQRVGCSAASSGDVPLAIVVEDSLGAKLFQKGDP